jgi:galactose oxidase
LIKGVFGASGPVISKHGFGGVVTDRRRFLKLAALTTGGAAGAVLISRVLAAGEEDGDSALGMVSEPTESPIGSPEQGSWSPLSHLVDDSGRGVTPIHSILLPSGLVLIFARTHGTAFLLNPDDADSTITLDTMAVPTKQSHDGLLCAGHAPLSDGRLLVAGGERTRREQETGLDYALLLDPNERTWTRIVPDMRGRTRWYPTVTKLADSRILITGEYFDWGESVNRSVELFDPVAYDAGVFPWTELISSEQNPWQIEANGEDYTHVFLLPRPVHVDGYPREVVMIGKTGVVHFVNVTHEFTDPTNRFALRPNNERPDGAGADGASSVLLPNGTIMIVGGSSERNVQQRADIYDPIQDQWRSIETGVARYYPTALLLPDGTVFVINGLKAGVGDSKAPQIIDPGTRRVMTGPSWPDQKVRGYHNTALLLPDGRILTAGGGRSDARIFSPGYLFAPDLRPKITSMPESVAFGRSFIIGFENGPVHRVTMMALGAMTHCFDHNQRLVELYEGVSEDGTVTVSGPPDPSVAPPGDYLLFLLRRVKTADHAYHVPSVGGLVRVAWDDSRAASTLRSIRHATT